MQGGANNSEILTVKEPSVQLDELTVSNVTERSQQKTIADHSKVLGSYTPLIKINSYELVTDQMIKFKISSTGFVPTIDVVFIDSTRQFEGDFAKDGDLLEIYVRSRNNAKFKKIRIDFDIIKITSSPSSDNKSTYSIRGIMRVPDLFSEQQVSLSPNSSYNHLLEICDLIQLGFASNETKTDDEMPRFNANNTMKDLLNKTVETSYKDENSFYTSYIDLYYYLCFVNVNNLFSLNEDIEDGTIDTLTTLVQEKGTDSEGTDGKVIFTNHPKYAETSNAITSYRLFNNAGDIWMKNGYKRYAQYMDMDSYEFQSFFVDPLTTEGAESNFVLLKGKRDNNYYEKQNKFAYMGRMQSTLNDGNLHPNYHYAKILNFQNNQELNKMGLTITTKDISSNIYRYKRIPIVIFENDGSSTNKLNMERGDRERGDEVEQSGTETYDRDESWVRNGFLSGFYVVRDYSINWDRVGGFSQTVNVIRREWPTPNTAGMIKSKA